MLNRPISLWYVFTFDLLGLKSNRGAGSPEREKAYGKIVDLVLKMRQRAKEAKDWATSDQIRNTLTDAGFIVQDTKDSATWKLNK